MGPLSIYHTKTVNMSKITADALKKRAFIVCVCITNIAHCRQNTFRNQQANNLVDNATRSTSYQNQPLASQKPYGVPRPSTSTHKSDPSKERQKNGMKRHDDPADIYIAA